LRGAASPPFVHHKIDRSFMNRSFAVLALALTFSLTARADDASQHARAQELVSILHSERMVTQISGAILKQVSDAARQVTGSNPSPENQTRLTEFNKKATDLVNAQFSWDVMGPQIVNIYAKAFTEDELTAILNFYKSPAGTAFLAKAPDINQQLQQLAQPKLAALQTQLREAFEEFRKTATPTGPPTLQNLPPEGAPAGSVPPTTGLSAPAPKSTTPSNPVKPATPPTK
jgi:hypothetical protein